MGSTILLAAVLLGSCKKQQKEIQPAEIPQSPEKISWYYFADGNFKKTEKPAAVPEAQFRPWTEAVRISEASCTDPNGLQTPKGIALVNRTGVLVFDDEKIDLYRDTEIFSSTTASNLVFYGDTPVFSVYRSTFFNERKTPVSALHTFLVQFNLDQKVSYPILTVENLGLPSTSEITDFVWNGQYWTCSVKDTGPEKIQFSYLTFQPKESITSIYPTTAESSIHISNTTMEAFRQIKSPENFSKAPSRVKELLSTLPDNLKYSVTVNTASGFSPRTYLHGATKEDTPELKATALLCDTWGACLFTDGTLFLNGALYDSHILNHGKNLGLRLPKLPSGFSYSGFTISGTKLYAAWEETSFFSTARSGFLCADLNEILYKKEINR